MMQSSTTTLGGASVKFQTKLRGESGSLQCWARPPVSFLPRDMLTTRQLLLHIVKSGSPLGALLELDASRIISNVPVGQRERLLALVQLPEPSKQLLRG
jgi:hypothetical protein